MPQPPANAPHPKAPSISTSAPFSFAMKKRRYARFLWIASSSIGLTAIALDGSGFHLLLGCIHLSIPQHAISPGFIKYHVLVLYLVYRIAGIVKIGNVILWNWLDVSLLYRKAVSISSAGGFCYPLLYKFHTQASIFVSTPTLTNRIFKPFFDGVQIYFCTPILVYKFCIVNIFSKRA